MSGRPTENDLRVLQQQILLLRRRLQELIAATAGGGSAVDPAGALDGDGTLAAPLAVLVDGVTIIINGLNQLEAVGGGGAGTPSATVAALDGTGAAGSSSDYSRGDHRHADTNRPTNDEKAALAGTGTPSGANRYVTADSLAALGAALGKRATVRVATTATVTIATALNNGDTLDGVSLVTGDLVLVKNQAAPEQNGVYVVGVSPARDAQFDTYNEHPGALIAVQEGTAGADTLWLCTSNVGGTLNTTAIAFATVSTGITQLTSDVTAGPGSGSQAATIATGAVTPAKASTALKTRQIVFTLDGMGVDIPVGSVAYVCCPVAGTITGARLLGTAAGSLVIDVKKDATYLPTTSIVASAPPTLSGVDESNDTTLTGWTTAVSAGDFFGFEVTTSSGVPKAVLQLTLVQS